LGNGGIFKLLRVAEGMFNGEDAKTQKALV